MSSRVRLLWTFNTLDTLALVFHVVYVRKKPQRLNGMGPVEIVGEKDGLLA